LILNQSESALVKLVEQPIPCIIFTMLEHTLNDSATIGMSGKALHLTLESLDNELDMFGRNALDSLLNDVVSILITDTCKDMIVQLLHQSSLLVRQDMLKCLKRVG
jgi:hypothetical protein